MPIPGSSLVGLAFTPAVLGDLYYTSLCTFLRDNKTQAASGQEVHEFVAIDAAHTNIPCRTSPLILIRPQDQEKQHGEFQTSEAKLQVNLNQYVADASVEWQLVIDGVTYEIVAVENDGSKLSTRIGVGRIIPFNG